LRVDEARRGLQNEVRCEVRYVKNGTRKTIIYSEIQANTCNQHLVDNCGMHMQSEHVVNSHLSTQRAGHIINRNDELSIIQIVMTPTH
jgi:hypothetical protein